jgi:hypothetical protein
MLAKRQVHGFGSGYIPIRRLSVSGNLVLLVTAWPVYLGKIDDK